MFQQFSSATTAKLFFTEWERVDCNCYIRFSGFVIHDKIVSFKFSLYRYINIIFRYLLVLCEEQLCALGNRMQLLMKHRFYGDNLCCLLFFCLTKRSKQNSKNKSLVENSIFQ